MKIILAMVVSLDGKTTKWGEPKIYGWTSKEDQALFSPLIQKPPLVIMGRKTFAAAKKIIRLSPTILRIVITREPNKYRDLSVPGQLEFTNDNPKTLIKKLASRGFTEALLMGGEQVNTSFFKAKLINEIWLTIEPLIFGAGNNLVLPEKFNIDLSLQDIERLNEKGTLLLKYKVND
ncbi:MAG: dihydrofolate reductase [Patescibacteria group bacterium]